MKAPRYTRKGLKPYRGEYCLKHAKSIYPVRELVNMNLPQCKAPPYCDERAKWGRKEEDGTARATACELHREEGMVVGGHRYCSFDPSCLSRAHFAYPWSDKLEFSCRKHAQPNMLRVDSQAYRDARADYEASNLTLSLSPCQLCAPSHFSPMSFFLTGRARCKETRS